MPTPSTPSHASADHVAGLDAALALIGRGDVEGASGVARKALQDGIEHPLFLQLRAGAWERAGRPLDACADLERARRLAPTDVGVMVALGNCLGKLHRFGDALSAFDAAIALLPRFAPAWYGKGLAHQRLHQHRRAEDAFRRALASDPLHADAAARAARLAAHRGDWEEALSLADRARRSDPAQPEAWQATIEAHLGQDRAREAETAARRWCGQTRAGTSARAAALSLLGDSLDLQGRFKEAYAAYRTGNDILAKAASPAGSSEGRRASAHLDRLISAFAGETPERWGPAVVGATPPQDPVFLVGFLRSGTTLLEQALAGRPRLSVLEEEEALTEATQDFLGGEEGVRRLARLPASEGKRYREAYWARVAHAGVDVGDGRLLDKMPLNAAKLPIIAKLFPRAHVVFAIRDPRDVVLSCFRRRLRPSSFSEEMLTLKDTANLYDRYMTLAVEYLKVLRVNVVWHRHERFVADPAQYMPRLIAALGLPDGGAFADVASRVRTGDVASQSAPQIARGLNASGVGHWRNYFQDLEGVAGILSPWVRGLGYPDS